MALKEKRIRFSDGREGVQREYELRDGSWELTEIVVTKDRDGSPCRHVYAKKSDLSAHVYSFSALGRVTWEVVG